MAARSWTVLIVIAIGAATACGELSEVEPLLEEECPRVTVRRLSKREIWESLLKTARCRWLLWRCGIAASLLLIVAMLLWAEWIKGGQILSLWLCVIAGAATGFEVIQSDDALQILYPGGMRLVLSKDAPYWEQMMDVEMVRLLLLRDSEGNKVFSQAQVGELFGLSRQMTNRRKRLVEETGDLVPLVKREYEKSVLRDDVMRRIAEIVAQDWWKSDEEIAAQLLSEGLVRKICAGTIRKALSRIDGRLLSLTIIEPDRLGMSGWI